MEDDQAQLTARALARAQLEGAYASELDRRAVDDQALARPALFNLSLAVRESDEDDEDDDGLKIHISAGQTPLDATNAFVEASDVPISTEVARKIAVRLLEDQRALAWLGMAENRPTFSSRACTCRVVKMTMPDVCWPPPVCVQGHCVGAIL